VRGETTNRSFDELARALAEGSLSRRRALKLFAGTALASLIPSRALADDCVRVCHVPFDRDTEECDFANAETRCVSRRERRRHLENHPCDCRGRCANCLTSTTSTSTSTSTTSTSTTPMCIANGGTCSTPGDCCSGNCVGDTCVSSVAPNRITCQCANTTLTGCSFRDCSEAVQLCVTVCELAEGGVVISAPCVPNDPTCP
jgi:hypothetical protein